MGCRRLTYYPNRSELNEVSSEKELTLKNTVQTSRSKNLYRYCGKEKDSESGLYYFGQRFYSPWTCRFISVDPAKEQRAWLTPYNYVQNNPINLTDPDGALDDGGGGDPPPIDSSLQGNPQSTNPTTEKTKVHNVKKGDTLSQIAADNDISVESLREANNLDPANDRKLQIGTELQIPGTQPQSQPTQNTDFSFDKPFRFLDNGSAVNTPLQSGNENEGVDPIGAFSLGIGLTGEALKTSSSSFRLGTSTKPLSPKIYPSGWGGNQFTNTFKFTKVGKLLGPFGFGLGLGNDVRGLRQYYLNGADDPNAVSPAKFGVNTTIGLYGLTPTLGGAIIAPIYFGLETFYPGGTEQALKDKAQRDAKTSEALGRPFNSANQGTYSPFKW